MRQRKLTDQQRIDAVTAYLAGAGSYQAVAEQFQISSRTLRDLVALYQYHGPDALKSSVTNNTYPPELKRQAVEEYQSGQGTQRDICLKYNIRARTQLRNWIRQYGSGDLSSAAPPRANLRKKKPSPGARPPSTNASTSSAIVLPTTEITSFPPVPTASAINRCIPGSKNMTPTDSTASSTDAADIAIQRAWIPSNVQNTKTRSSRTRSPASRQKCSR